MNVENKSVLRLLYASSSKECIAAHVLHNFIRNRILITGHKRERNFTTINLNIPHKLQIIFFKRLKYSESQLYTYVYKEEFFFVSHKICIHTFNRTCDLHIYIYIYIYTRYESDHDKCH